MPRFVGLLLAIALLAACQPDRQTEAPPTGTIVAVRCGTLIDGLADEPLGARLVLITGERITAVLPADAEPPVTAKIVDLREYTCLPGLIDTHTHIALLADDSSDMTIYYRRPMSETLAITERNARITLHAGFTTVRNVGDYFPTAITTVRDRIRAGEIPGPRIQTAGPYLTIPGGGGDLVVPGHDDSEIPAG